MKSRVRSTTWTRLVLLALTCLAHPAWAKPDDAVAVHLARARKLYERARLRAAEAELERAEQSQRTRSDRARILELSAMIQLARQRPFASLLELGAAIEQDRGVLEAPSHPNPWLVDLYVCAERIRARDLSRSSVERLFQDELQGASRDDLDSELYAALKRGRFVCPVEAGPLPGTLFVAASHTGTAMAANVWVGGEHLGTTPLTMPLAPGAYEVVIRGAGTELRRRVRLEAGGRARLDVDLASVAPHRASPSANRIAEEAPAPVRSPSRMRAWGWGTLGVGGAAGVASGVLLGLAQGASGAADDAESVGDLKAAVDRAESMRLSSVVLAGVAGGLVITGAVLVAFGGDSGVSPSVAVSAEGDAGWVGVAGQW